MLQRLRTAEIMAAFALKLLAILRIELRPRSAFSMQTPASAVNSSKSDVCKRLPGVHDCAAHDCPLNVLCLLCFIDRLVPEALICGPARLRLASAALTDPRGSLAAALLLRPARLGASAFRNTEVVEMAPASHNNLAPLVAVLIQCMAVACNYLASKHVVRVDVINEREAVLAAGEGRPLEVFLLCIASWHASFLHRQEPPRSGLAGLVHRFASHKSNPRVC